MALVKLPLQVKHPIFIKTEAGTNYMTHHPFLYVKAMMTYLIQIKTLHEEENHDLQDSGL